MIFIGLGGRKGSGKTTIANELIRQAHNMSREAQIVSFATPLKDMTRALLSHAGFDEGGAKAAMTEFKRVPYRGAVVPFCEIHHADPRNRVGA